MVDFELVNNAYHVLDSLLLGLATVLRRPADKVMHVRLRGQRLSSMPHPRRRLTRDILGLLPGRRVLLINFIQFRIGR